MKIDFERQLHALQIEADGITAIITAIDNTLSLFDESETITAIMALAKLSKDHANNIQAVIEMLDRGGGNGDPP